MCLTASCFTVWTHHAGREGACPPHINYTGADGIISPLQFYPSLTPELCFTEIYYHLLLEQSFLVILLAMSGCLLDFLALSNVKRNVFWNNMAQVSYRSDAHAIIQSTLPPLSHRFPTELG